MKLFLFAILLLVSGLHLFLGWTFLKILGAGCLLLAVVVMAFLFS